jgi:hypothetical protein
MILVIVIITKSAGCIKALKNCTDHLIYMGNKNKIVIPGLDNLLWFLIDTKFTKFGRDLWIDWNVWNGFWEETVCIVFLMGFNV